MNRHRGRKQPAPIVKPPCPGNQLTADQYMEHWAARKVWTHLDRPKHMKRLHWCADQVQGRRAVDVGCAYGHSTVIMAQRHPAEWCGCDLAAKAVSKAVELFPTAGIGFFWLPRAEDLAGTGPYDTVIASEVIEHVEDDQAFLAELCRASRGRVILTTPTIDAQDPGHVRLYTRATLEALLRPYRATIVQDAEFFFVRIEVDQ